jgi:hypothetical protein
MPTAVVHIAREFYVTAVDTGTSCPGPQIGISAESGAGARVSSWQERHFDGLFAELRR